MSSQDIASRGERRFRAGTAPSVSKAHASLAFVFSAAAVAASWRTLIVLRPAVAGLLHWGRWLDVLFAALALAATLVTYPAVRGLLRAQQARDALSANDLIAARSAMAASHTASWIALGYSSAQLLLIGAVWFISANDFAVSRTFFMVPLMASSFGLVLRAFWMNVYLSLIAEAIVLAWGLVVAIAQLAPGEAGKPIRLIATTYVDVFRGLPAIITLYLIAFGIPLTGLPIVKDLSQQTFVILALVLSSGAYVAEIYRAGIVGVHWSQSAAARSLGLSHLQTLRYVVVPQGVRHIIPPLLNSFIGLQKDTALVNVVGAVDSFNQAMIVASNHYNLSAVTIVAVLFVAITIPQARLVERLVERDRRRRRAVAG